MNAEYVKMLLQTTSSIFFINKNNKELCYFVKAGDYSVDDNLEIIIKDYIEEREFLLPLKDIQSITIKTFTDIQPDINISKEEYDRYVNEKKDLIIANNEKFDTQANILKDYYSFILPSEDNVFLLKTENVLKSINTMKHYGITNLKAFLEGSDEFLEEAKIKFKEVLERKAKDTIDTLNVEKQKFIESGDSDSADELDMIIELIHEMLSQTSFNDLTKLEDVFDLWPPILLPVPY